MNPENFERAISILKQMQAEGVTPGRNSYFNDDGSPCCSVGHLYARLGLQSGLTTISDQLTRFFGTNERDNVVPNMIINNDNPATGQDGLSAVINLLECCLLNYREHGTIYLEGCEPQ